MADQITSVQQNTDGSFVFGFVFDNGAGVTANTYVTLPPPAAGAAAYTTATAEAAVLPLALAHKTAWMTALGSVNVIGTVTL
jgi:predicted esterase